MRGSKFVSTFGDGRHTKDCAAGHSWLWHNIDGFDAIEATVTQRDLAAGGWYSPYESTAYRFGNSEPPKSHELGTPMSEEERAAQKRLREYIMKMLEGKATAKVRQDWRNQRQKYKDFFQSKSVPAGLAKVMAETIYTQAKDPTAVGLSVDVQGVGGMPTDKSVRADLVRPFVIQGGGAGGDKTTEHFQNEFGKLFNESKATCAAKATEIEAVMKLLSFGTILVSYMEGVAR